MQDLDLSLIYKILNWHKNKDYDQRHVGLFLPLPKDVADQFPEEGREGEDNSPSHITLLYIGDFPQEVEGKLLSIAKNVCSKFKPFKVRLGKKKKFVNDEQTVWHSPVMSKKLHDLHDELRKACIANQIPVSNKFPEYCPHVTIEYVNEGEKPKHKDVTPKGEWIIDGVWLWGTSEPYHVQLK